MHCRHSFNSNDMPECDRRLKSRGRERLRLASSAPLTHRLRQGDGGSFPSDTIMLVREAMKTIPGEYWTSCPKLADSAGEYVVRADSEDVPTLMIAVGPEKQATGDRDRHLPELANSALRTIDAPRDVPGRPHDCLILAAILDLVPGRAAAYLPMTTAISIGSLHVGRYCVSRPAPANQRCRLQCKPP